MNHKKAKGKMSIGIAVSFDGSLKKDFKIVTVHTSGSTATVTKWADGTRGGMNYIPNRVLRQMFENSGQRVIEEIKESGNEYGEKHLYAGADPVHAKRVQQRIGGGQG